MKIHCLFDAMIDPKELKEHPKNPNKHSDAQLERLTKILEYQGFRYPIKVSKLSGFITSGHGRLMAAKRMRLKSVPVVYQDYDDAEQEFADIVADNAIASWSKLDLSFINDSLGDLGPIDTQLLGIENFTDIFDPPLEIKEAENAPQFIVTVHLENEIDMQKIYEELNERGFACKLIT